MVLVWGGAGGLGSMAIQIVTNAGGRAVAVVSSAEKAEYAKSLGAVGYVNRKDFSHWGVPPKWDSTRLEGVVRRREGVRQGGLGRAGGEGGARAIVFDHPGEDTIPTSIFVCDRGGMVVICAGTSGYNTMVDVRYLWYMQKRYQGSHLFNDEQAAAFNDLVRDGRSRRCLGHTYAFDEIGARPPADGRREAPGGERGRPDQRPRSGLTDLPG